MYIITWNVSDHENAVEYMADNREDFERKLYHLINEGHHVTVNYIDNDED